MATRIIKPTGGPAPLCAPRRIDFGSGIAVEVRAQPGTTAKPKSGKQILEAFRVLRRQTTGHV